MEKVHQAVSADGLQIPIALMRRYGLDSGSNVVLEMEPDGIRVIPARPDRAAIESRALRYLLASVGDAATVEGLRLENETGWKVNVFGRGLSEPAGALIYTLAGALVSDQSTPPAEIRRRMRDAAGRS